MALHCPLLSRCSTPGLKGKNRPHASPLAAPFVPPCPWNRKGLSSPLAAAGGYIPKSPRMPFVLPMSKAQASRAGGGGEESDGSDSEEELMTEEERAEMRREIREVLARTPEVDETTDPAERKIKMEKLLADYPLVVEEDDPDWPEDADGRGFKFDQFFDKITIKNERPQDDEDYDSNKEVTWQDDNYIVPIRDITAGEWEDTVFKDFNPLIILVHNRYKRPRENERARNELERAVRMFWESGLPSPRCVAVDACCEHDLVSALQVTIFPEILFTKAGKILHRDKAVRTADEWSKMMAFFYYKAVRPSCLSRTAGQSQEKIPALS